MSKIKWTFEPETKKWCARYSALDHSFIITVYANRKRRAYSLEHNGHYITSFKKLSNAKLVSQLIFNEQ